MSKLIIENKSSHHDYLVLSLVQSVIINGRISNNGKQYCYATRIKNDSGSFIVISKLNKCSDKFIILDEPKEQPDER